MSDISTFLDLLCTRPIPGLNTKQMRGLMSDLASTSRGRRTLSIHFPAFFDAYYCGMDYSPARERWLKAHDRTIAEAHELLQRLLYERPKPAKVQKRKLLQISERDKGKTEGLISTAVRTICLDRKARILLGGPNLSNARNRLKRIKALLLSPRVQEDWCSAPDEGFGPFLTGNKEGTRPDKAKGEQWSDTQIYINRTIESVDPTLEAVEIGGVVACERPTLGLFDDLEGISAHPTEARKRHQGWLKGVDRRFGTGTAQIYVCTRQHDDDIYANMLNDPDFQILEDRGHILGA